MYRFDELTNMANRVPLIGMKAESLVRLREGGFNVPDGFVVASDEIGAITIEILASYADKNTHYAVRSSGTSEDLAGFSFAGQYDTFLNVNGHQNLLDAIGKCADSINNERVKAYAERSSIDISGSKMAVIIQRMVDSEKSGVAFSIDSVNGSDKEILIEAIAGLGEQLVSGHATPDTYSYNWYDDAFAIYNGGVLAKDEVKTLAKIVLDIQIFYGFPVDVEWAIADGTIYILQSRPITAITYRNIPDEWTTADFRDGGVSSVACKTLMGSLYGLVFNSSFVDSLKTIKLMPKSDNHSIYQIYFSRPYWSLTTEKVCFAKLPGYVEREIDEDMGVVPSYDGDGIVTKTNIRSLWSGIRAMAAIGKHIKRMESKTNERKADILERFARIERISQQVVDSAFCDYAQNDTSRMTVVGCGMDSKRINPNSKSADELHGIWVEFIKNDYFLSEYTYFSYIFCNMILSTLFKDKIKKHIPSNEIMNLMIGLKDLSHMRPIYEMWDMSRREYSDAEFDEFVAKYRHHSQHELDISYPNWDETPNAVRAAIADLGKLDDNLNPKALGEKQRQKYLDTLAKVPNKLHKDVARLRNFLWWREEFRDISTKSYYLIRALTLALGRAWENDGTLDKMDDIFFLSTADIESKANLARKAERNKKYYYSFINFKNPNELGNRHVMRQERIIGSQILKGIPCSGETVTASARVIRDIHDAERLEKGDILVTQCTDPAWTAIFSKISGVITETGGMLSHAAVVSREYGLPCILLVKNATLVLKDGDVITMDCKTGEIYKRSAER